MRTGRFAKLSEGCEKKQAALKQSAEELRNVAAAAETQTVNEPAELTPVRLRELVEKVVVHVHDKSSGHCVQRIDVHIGEIDFPPNLGSIAKRQPHDAFASYGCLLNKENFFIRRALYAAPAFALNILLSCLPFRGAVPFTRYKQTRRFSH